MTIERDILKKLDEWKNAADCKPLIAFSIVTDFYHFASGESTEDYWLPKQEHS